MQVDPGQEPAFASMLADPRYAEIGLEFMNRTYIKSVRHQTTHTVHPTIHLPFSADNCTACAPHKEQFLVDNPPVGTGSRRGDKTINLSPNNPKVVYHTPNNTRSTKKRKR